MNDRTKYIARVGMLFSALGIALGLVALIAGLRVYTGPVYTRTPPPTPSPGVKVASDLSPPPAGRPILLPVSAPPTVSPYTYTRVRTPTSRPTATPGFTFTSTFTPTPSATSTPTPAPSSTASATLPATALTRVRILPSYTPPPSGTPTPAPSDTPTTTPTPTVPTATHTFTMLPSPTATATLAITPTHTPTPTFTVTASPTFTSIPTLIGAARPPDRLIIPSIGLDTAVVETGWETVTLDGVTYNRWRAPNRFAAGWHKTSAGVGQAGNLVLNGHHNIHGAVFRRLVDVTVGDNIELKTGAHTYIYEVVRTMVLAEEDQPTAVRLENARWVLPTPDERVTLVTCWPADDNSHRLIVVARPVDVVQENPFQSP